MAITGLRADATKNAPREGPRLFELSIGQASPFKEREQQRGKGVPEDVMYANIKLQIFRKGIHQNQLARTLGMDETLLSKIIRGFREPSEAQRKQLADSLNASEQWLFEKSEFSGASEILAKTEIGSRSGNDRD